MLSTILFIFLLADYANARMIFRIDKIDASSFHENSTEITIEASKVSDGKWNLPYVTAHSAILIDAQTGDVLYERDAHKKRPIASTTKILTAILAIELADLDEITVVSEKADRVGESSLYLNKGEKIKLGELLEGALLRSGNDACVAIAEQTAGSLDEFIQLMNKKAIALGAYNSNFVNPHGLPANNHYSTAYDLALIARYAMENPVFSEIVAQKYSVVSFEEPSRSESIKNTNKLLWNYPLADGIKTGTTNAAGKCLVASASNEGRRLICVVLNAPDRFGDAQRLLQWGLNNSEIVQLGEKGDQIANYISSGLKVPAVLAEDAKICIEKDKVQAIKAKIQLKQSLYPPIKAGDVLGDYHILLDGKIVKTIPLLAEHDSLGSIINFSGTLNLVLDHILDLITQKG